jgi:hypothetical protein
MSDLGRVPDRGGRGAGCRREGVAPMSETDVSGPAAATGDVVTREGGSPAGPAPVSERRSIAVPAPGWTPGRVVAIVIGSLMALVSIGLLGAGGTALWAELSRRDAEGYVTSDVHTFSTAGSALTTDPVELGDPGISWFYSGIVLGEVRIRVTPSGPDSEMFVGIGPSADVDRYLDGVSKTVIEDLWTDRLETSAGGTPGSAPESQDFWVASVAGTGPQTLTWDPANGSWTVVVMNADGQPGVGVATDLGAEMPLLMAIAVGSLAFGLLFLAGGVLLIGGAIRRSRDSGRGALR